MLDSRLPPVIRSGLVSSSYYSLQSVVKVAKISAMMVGTKHSFYGGCSCHMKKGFHNRKDQMPNLGMTLSGEE